VKEFCWQSPPGRRRWRRSIASSRPGYGLCSSEPTGCPSIRIGEDVSAAELGIDHLIEMGHQRIAIVTASADAEERSGQRLWATLPAAGTTGHGADTDLIWEGKQPRDDVAACAAIDCAT